MKFVLKYVVGGTIIFFCIFLNIFEPLLGKTEDISMVYINLYGYLPIGDKHTVVEVLRSGCNILVVTFIISQWVYRYIEGFHQYVFTRTKKRSMWLGKVYIRLIGYVSLYIIFQYILVFIISYILGFRVVNGTEFIAVVFSTIVSNILAYSFYSILVISIGIFTNYLTGYVTFTLITFVSLILSDYLIKYNSLLFKLNPFLQNSFLVKDSYHSLINQTIFISGYTLITTMIVLITYSCILTMISFIKIKRRDIY